MTSANAVITGSYDYGEVAGSILIAIAASYAALDLAGRVTAASGRVRAAWLTGGACAMGIGIWEMHFKGLLAFRLPVPVAYHWPTVLVSFVVAVFASAVALYLVSRQEMGPVRLWTGSLIMGGGITGLHYLDMAAMRLAAVCRYDLRLVMLSVVLAIVFSLAALILAFGLREESSGTPGRRIASALLMGAAISAMHYAGMASATFVASPVVPDLSLTVSISPLANNGIAIVTLLVVGAAIVTSSVDRQTEAEVRRLNERLEQRVAERTGQLEALNQALRKEIVERERAEETLRESGDHLRLVIDTIPQQIWSGPPDGSLDFCNAQWLSFMGLTQEETQGEGWQRMLHPDDRERVLKAWRESVAIGTPYEQEERHRRADGQYRWFLSRGVPLRDSEGHIIRWYGTNTDIEDRKGAEDRLRLLVDTTPTMLHSARPDGYIDFFNQRWLEYVGLSLDDMCGWRWTRVVHPDDVDEELVRWHSSLATGEPFEAEARVRRADGEYRLQLHRKVPARDDQGKIIKWYGSAIDIEDRSRAELALQEVQAELSRITRATTMGELTAAIGHEVNQPLAAIVTNANFCLRQLAAAAPDIGRVHEAIAEIASDGTRASTVISRIRALLQKGVPERVELDINQIIEEVGVLLRAELTRNRVSLRTDLGGDLPRVSADRVQLQQVVINLVMNGIEALRTSTDKRREILIKSAKNPDCVLVQVQDSGPGITPELAGRIFEPFLTTKAEGIGMGLSISRSIIESHGGQLSLVPTSQGALFQFTLPINPNDAS